MKTIIEKGRAPAKVNLHLNVFRKLPDGYHEIISVFQKVSLADELMVRLHYDDRSIADADCTVRGLESVAEPGKDTMTKAVRFFGARYSIPMRVEIDINKRIPSGAGLGGGSSDAATVLLILCNVFQKKVDQDFLSACARSVGADVPFFISGGHAAVVEGIGDILTPISPKNFFGYVLVPRTGESTADAYARLDEKGLCARVYDRAELERMYSGPIKNWRFANDFARVVRPPETRLPQGSFYTLTGSGSAGILLNSIFPPFKADFDGDALPALLL